MKKNHMNETVNKETYVGLQFQQKSNQNHLFHGAHVYNVTAVRSQCHHVLIKHTDLG